MNAVEFLRTVWPVKGPFCIARGPFVMADTGRPYFKHAGFETREEAAAFSTRHAMQDNLFFATHALKGFVEETGKDGKTYKRAKRTHANMRGAVVFHGDLDCGPDKPYANKTVAGADLARFIAVTGLPWPLVVCSGKGLHIYWLLEDEIESQQWRVYAETIKALAAHHELHLDPAATADMARILRVVGTFNRKDPSNPIKVKVLPGPGGQPARKTPNATFLALLATAAQVLPDQDVAETVRMAPSELPKPSDLGKVCPTFVRMVKEAPTARGVVWMNTNLLSLHTTGGAAMAHKLASQHPDYKRDETQGKLDRLLDRKMGPPTCGTLQGLYPDDSPCLKCPNFGRPKSSPVVFARRLPSDDLPEDLPPPQQPYARTKRGIEFLPPINPATGLQPPAQVICPFDLYPTQVVDEAWAETKGVSWTAVLPLRGRVEFRLPADIYTDETTLISLLAHKGVTVDKAKAKHLGGYVSHYIRLLQAHRAEQVQHESVGWTPPRDEFIWGALALTATGEKPAVLSPMLANVAAHLHAKGTLAGQIRALQFYDHVAYIRQRFMILVSLGAPLLYMTDHFGVIVNLSGPSGASKTTCLHAAAGIWGRGEKLTIGGTDDDATANGRAGRVRIMANLPVCVDEITLMPADQLKRMAMSVTQATSDKIRHKRDGTERHIPDTAKSTVMLCTSNNSAHALMAMNNQAGNAGSYRVMEITCPRLSVHTKTEADDFVRQLRANYGWLGPAFIRYVMQNMDAVRAMVVKAQAEVDKRGAVTQEERFWAAAIVVAVVAARICRKLDLLSWDAEELLAWACEVYLPMTRRVVHDSYADPIDVLHHYIESVANNMLVVEQTNDGMGRGKLIWVATRKPQGALKARLETSTGALYLAPQPLRDYCDQRKLVYDTVVAELVGKRVLAKERMKLSRNIADYESGLVWNLRVDLTHELMAGHPPITVDDKVVHLYPGAGAKTTVDGG